jgi:hypothetical protein
MSMGGRTIAQGGGICKVKEMLCKKRILDGEPVVYDLAVLQILSIKDIAVGFQGRSDDEAVPIG